MNRWLKYFLILTLCTNKAFAQLLPFKHYRSKDGLISDKVTAVIRDEKGLLWVGTDFGINWFDGSRFIKPEIKMRSGQLYITNFLEDRQNNIWALSFYNGIYKYDGRQFTNYLPDSSRLESNANSALDMVQLDDRRFIVSTDQNVYWFDGSHFSLFDPKNSLLSVQINTIALIDKQWILLGHPHGLFIYKYENDKWNFFAEAFRGSEINKILLVSNKIWIATDKGLLYFDAFNKLVTEKPSQILFDKIVVSYISQNKKTGELWVCANQLYKLSANRLSGYNLSNGLTSIPGKAYVDEEEIAWMCSANGLTKMAKQYYMFYDLRKGPSHSIVNAVAPGENYDLWLGTYDGFVHKKGNSFSAYRTAGKNKIGYVSWILNTVKYGLLAGTDAGIVSITGNKVEVKCLTKTTKAFEDENGVVWAGAVDGRVYKFDGNNLSEVNVKPFWGDFIDAVYKDQYGYLWIGYRSSGIRKYALVDDECKLVKEYSNNTGYKDVRIRCCYLDKKNNLLFGTRTNGLFVIPLTKQDRVWQINSLHGLSANWVRSIHEDAQGTLYLATNQGLNLLSGNYAKPFIRKVHLLNDEVGEQTTSILAQRDTVSVGTEEGLIEYYPQVDKNKTVAPPAFITEISINGKQDSLLPAYFSFAEKKLKPGSNFIAFEFTGINLRDDVALQYRYKLEGLDENWTYAGVRNFVSYHLTPGSYTFKAEARNSFGEWSNHPATFSFMIPAPFWKSWWFVAGTILLVVLLLFLVYRYRVQHALKLERLRHRISTDLHDDIGSTLSSISILSEIVSKEKDIRQSSHMIQEIKHSSVTLMEKMDDIVWSINPQNDSIENLMMRIKRFASKLLEAKEIDYTINISHSIHNATLDMESRQHIYLIMKEAINNQVKYSRCTRSYIGVKYDQNHLQIEVSDNGIGFDEQRVQPGNGILSMKKRAEAIGGKLIILTKPDKGTTIQLRVKIK